MRYARVSVNRNETSRVSLTIPAWEIPILGLIYGDENVVDSGEFVESPNEYPAADAEFDRLSRRYKDNTETSVAFVAAIYGQGPAGIRALQREIDAEKYAEFPDLKPKAVGTVKPIPPKTPVAPPVSKGPLSLNKDPAVEPEAKAIEE